MNWILKNKNKRAKALFVALFLVFAFSLSYSIAKADPQTTTTLTTTAATTSTSTVPTSDACHIQIFDPSTWLQCALIGVLQAVGYLFAIAATLFAWVIDASNISGPTGVLEKQAILDVWYMVRDLLNMTFILILLFAAFCTIFQVDKWNLKKVWLNILINALLVNFSYPIARFVIDISNVAFYYFVKNLFTSTTTTVTGSSIFSMFSATSGIGDILAPQSYVSYANAYLIIMIIFVFTFGMTLLIVAALFVVRLVALAMLIMFSPIGFVGYIFPSTGKYADKWWSNLFSYSFFAPIMIFVMAISLRIAQQIKDANMSAMYIQGGVNAGNDQAKFIANAAFYFIPLIILWAGMGVAKSFSIEGAAMVTGKVKGWGKSLANMPLGVGKYAWKQSGVPGGVKKGWENARKSGKIFGVQNKFTDFALKSGLAAREAGVAGLVGDRTKGFTDSRNKIKDEANKEDIKKKIENFEKTKMPDLHKEIEDAINNPPKERDKKIEAAAKVKQAMSRGSSFEKEIEKKINTDINMGKLSAPLPMRPDPSSTPPSLERLPDAPPKNATPVQLAQYTAKHAEVIDKNRKAEAAHKEAITKWVKEKEKLEKEFIQEQKAQFMDNARDLIKDAENAGKKIKPDGK